MMASSTAIACIEGVDAHIFHQNILARHSHNGVHRYAKIHRELATLMKNLKSQFDGQVKLKESFDFESENDRIEFVICPNDGVYKDCEIEFTMSLKNYPAVAPRLLAKSHIVHPNIDYFTYDNYYDVCLNVLTDWGSYDKSYRSIDLVIQGVLFLFYEPELTDHFIPGEALYDMSTLQEAVDKTKYGGSTDGYYLREWITFQEFSPIYKGTIPQKTTEDEAEQPSQENGLDEVTVKLVSLGIDSGIEEEKTTDADTNVQEETISAVLDVPKLGFKK